MIPGFHFQFLTSRTPVIRDALIELNYLAISGKAIKTIDKVEVVTPETETLIKRLRFFCGQAEAQVINSMVGETILHTEQFLWDVELVAGAYPN